MSKMKFSPVPQYAFKKVTDITPEFLQLLGVRFLMVDMDNTIATYGVHSPSAEVMKWADAMKRGGVGLFIVSNTRRAARVTAFAEALGVGHVRNAYKPSPKGIHNALRLAGYGAEESAFAGDQVYTDVLAANRAGVLSFAVRPLSLQNPLIAIRYALEAPFRALCKNKMGSGNRAAGTEKRPQTPGEVLRQFKPPSSEGGCV